ncbi:hypothetical protein TNCV_1072271 [Trichonephila clavipes]|nr:hypothetical protein TNCV_1072271 [Trichonephila clavipes]
MSDMRCKDLVVLPLTCQSTSIKHMMVGIFVCNDACPDHLTTSFIVVSSTMLEGRYRLPGFLQMKTRLELLSRLNCDLLLKRTGSQSPSVL